MRLLWGGLFRCVAGVCVVVVLCGGGGGVVGSPAALPCGILLRRALGVFLRNSPLVGKLWAGALQLALYKHHRTPSPPAQCPQLGLCDRTAGRLQRVHAVPSQMQSAAVPSADNLDFVMESLALGHVVIDQKQVGGWKRERERVCVLFIP